MNERALVSVIIPVYNVEAYLRECLESILNQTLKNIEVICVDDGSTDDSLKILMEYAAADSRISVLCQDNSGLSAARNAAFSRAGGRYVYFMDSDDKLELNALEELTAVSEKEELDILFFDGSPFLKARS